MRRDQKQIHKPFRIDGNEAGTKHHEHSDFMSELETPKPFMRSNSDLENVAIDEIKIDDQTPQLLDIPESIDPLESETQNIAKRTFSKLGKILNIKSKRPKLEEEDLNITDYGANTTQTSHKSKSFITAIGKIFRILSSKIAKISLIAIVLVLGFVMLIPKIFDNSDLKFYLSQKATKLLNANLSIKSNLEIVLLPTPAIIAHDVFIENYKPTIGGQDEKIINLYFKSLKIDLPWIGFLNKKTIDGISAEGALIEIWQDNAVIENVAESKFKSLLASLTKDNKDEKGEVRGAQSEAKSSLKTTIFSIDELEQSINDRNTIPNIEIIDSELVFFNKNGIYRQAKNLEANFEISDNDFTAKGSFSSEAVQSIFEVALNFNSKATEPDSYIKFNSDMLDMKITGIFPAKNEGIFSNFKGSTSIEIKNFKKFYKSFFANNDSLAQNLSEGVNDIKINAEINNQDHEINLKNLTINSSAIDGKISLTANKPKDLVLVDFKADIDNLNLDSFWIHGGYKDETRLGPIDSVNFSAPASSEPKIEGDDDVQSSQSLKLKSALEKVSKNLDLAAELTFKKIIFKETEIKDVSLYATVANEGKISIAPLLFHLGDNSIFRVNGIIDNNDIDWKFVGNFDAAGDDFGGNLKWIGFDSDNLKLDTLKKFRLYSDISMGDYGSRLNRLYLNLNQGESEITGEIKISNSRSGRIIATNLYFDRFKLDNYFLLNKENSYFAPGLLTKKLLWLNEIKDYYDIHLQFDKLEYKDQRLIDQAFAMSVGRGYVIIPNTLIKSQDNDLSFDLAIDIAEKKQSLKLNLNANRLTLNSGEDGFAANYMAKNSKNFFDRFYSLPSIEKFDGNLAININELLIDGKKFEKFTLASNIKNGALSPAKLGLNLYNGQFNFQGAIQVGEEKIINGNFSLNNLEIADLLNDLFEIQNIAGITNIAGNLLSGGTNKNDFLKKLKSEISFSVNRPIITGFGINDLMKKMFQLDLYRKELNDPEKIIFDSSGKSSFKDAKGIISIKDGDNGKFKIKLSAPAVNSVFFGNFAAANRAFDGTLNTIFLTGSSTRQIPLNIALNLKYRPKTLIYINNADQVRQYLGLTKIQAESIIVSSEKSPSPDLQQNDESKTIKTPQAELSKNDFDKVTQDIEKSNSAQLPEDQESTNEKVQIIKSNSIGN